MDAKSASKPPNGKVFWPIYLAIAAFAAVSLSYYVLAVLPPSFRGSVFRQTAKGWESLPPLASSVHGIKISPRGVVWVQTFQGISRLDGDSWHSFTSADFGTKYNYFRGDFALDGEAVWAAARDGVIHFDGSRWQRYPEAVATEKAVSIAAANGEVWVIDLEGDLSHFDGRAWAVRKLALPGASWDAASRSHPPKLALTAKGPLWLVFQGLWRFDGASWARVPGTTGETQLLGVSQPGSGIQNGKLTETRGGVWVRDAGGAVGFDVDGLPAVRYSMHDLGLLDSASIYGVAARIPVFAVASSQGVVWFDGNKWRGHQLKEIELAEISSVEVAPDGSLWGVGYPNTKAQSRLGKPFSLAAWILTLIVVGPPIWWKNRKARYERQAMREAMLHGTGSLPADLQEPESSWSETATAILTMLAVGGGAYWLVRRYWPEAPFWLLPVFFGAAHAVSNVMDALKKRKPRPSDPIDPGGLPRYDWAKSRPAILRALALALLLYGGNIGRQFHIQWLSRMPATKGLAFFLVGMFLFYAYNRFRSRLVERQIKRCHYTKALEMLDGPLGWFSTGLLGLLRADALFFSGRAEEAEPILRDLIETEREAGHKVLAFEHLGRVLMARSRYDEAKRVFEAAAKLAPTRSAVPSGLAEIRLQQGIEPAKALEDAERALRYHRESALERKSVRERLATIRGNQAWALASLGRASEAQQAIEAGARETDLEYLPEVAGLYWRGGMAMLAVENTVASAAHFRRAVEIDANGYYGKLAARHLTTHSVWGGAGLVKALSI